MEQFSLQEDLILVKTGLPTSSVIISALKEEENIEPTVENCYEGGI